MECHSSWLLMECLIYCSTWLLMEGLDCVNPSFWWNAWNCVPPYFWWNAWYSLSPDFWWNACAVLLLIFYAWYSDPPDFWMECLILCIPVLDRLLWWEYLLTFRWNVSCFALPACWWMPHIVLCLPTNTKLAPPHLYEMLILLRYSAVPDNTSILYIYKWTSNGIFSLMNLVFPQRQ